MILIAQIDPVAVLAGLGVILVANGISFGGLVGALISRSRRRWVIITGSVSLVIGVCSVALAIKESSDYGWSGLSVFLLTPLLFAVITIVRWTKLKPENA
jgi:hypothetical protein